MSLFLGVDGGNTKTIAIVATADGRPVGCGRAGPSDIYNAPTPALAIDEIAQAVKAALDGRDGSEVAGACFSLAGADWPEDIELLRSELGRRLGIAPPAVVNDAIGALRAGTSDGRGVSVVIGTYTAIGAGLASGEHWHVSFWGEPVYGFDLSRMAIDAAVRSQLGILPTSALCDLVPLRLGCTSVEEVVHRLTGRGLARPARARASLALLDAAAAGDAVACAALSRAAASIAEFARAGATGLGLEAPYPLVIAGGLLRHPSTVLVEAVAAALPELVPHPTDREPALGALLLACDLAGVALDPAMIERAFRRDGA